MDMEIDLAQNPLSMDFKAVCKNVLICQHCFRVFTDPLILKDHKCQLSKTVEFSKLIQKCDNDQLAHALWNSWKSNM